MFEKFDGKLRSTEFSKGKSKISGSKICSFIDDGNVIGESVEVVEKEVLRFSCRITISKERVRQLS